MNKAHPIQGVIPVLPVPFTDDQSLDLRAFAREIDWVVERPTDGLTLFGLASEYWKFSDDERVALAETLVQTVQGRKSVLISVTDNNRYNAERFARRFAKMWADALVVMPPHFMNPKADKVIDHCRAVADAVAPLQVVVQYSPAYIGVSLSAETLVRMHERSPNIGHIKVEPRPPGPMIDAIKDTSAGRLSCLIGQGGLTLADCRRRGIAGLMPGIAVVEVYRKLWDGLAVESPGEAILELNERMVTMVSHTVPSIDMWVASEKHMLKWRGVIDRTTLRDPSSRPEPEFFTHLRQCFERLRPYFEHEEKS